MRNKLRASGAAWLLVGCTLFLLQLGCPGATSLDQNAPPPNGSSAAPAGGDAAAGQGDSGAPAAPAEQNTPDWAFTSPAFVAGQPLPTKYTGDGDNISPPLNWSKPPDGTQELALICDDPDAPDGTYTQWLVYGMAPDLAGLPENIIKLGEVGKPALKQGLNSAHQIGYTGPKPPPGKVHHYEFTLYALSAALYLRPSATKADFQMVMEGKVIGRTQLVGTYSK